VEEEEEEEEEEVEEEEEEEEEEEMSATLNFCSRARPSLIALLHASSCSRIRVGSNRTHPRKSSASASSSSNTWQGTGGA
jgi:hypothetical protein